MASYFNINVQACRDMLGEAVHEQYPLVGASGDKNAVKVARMAANAEAEVIRRYTRYGLPHYAYASSYRTAHGTPAQRLFSEQPLHTGWKAVGDRYVMLRFYEVDADDLDLTDSDEVAFLEAMRRTVAFIVTHRIQTDPRGERRGLRRIRIGRHEEEYFGSSTGPSRLPTGWDQWLRPFDLKPPVFAS